MKNDSLPSLTLRELDSLSNKIISSVDLNSFLPKLSLILNALEVPETRNLAVSTCKHLYTRIKASPPSLLLPIRQLLTLFINQKDKIFFRQFVKLFLQLENRWDPNEELLPIILRGVCEGFKNSDDEDFIFRCTAQRLTLEVNLVREGIRTNDDELDVEYVDNLKKEKLRMNHYFSFLNQSLEGKQKILDFFTDILMFKFEDQANGQNSPVFWRTKRRLIANTKDTVPSSFLNDLKITIFRLFEADIFGHDSVLIPIIIGLCDYNHNIEAIAERTMRQLDIDYENDITIQNLVKLFLNQLGRPSTENEKRKALVLLRKSEKATRKFPEIREVLFNSMLSNIASLTIKRLGFDLFKWMIEVSFSADNAIHVSEARLIFNEMVQQLSSPDNYDTEHLSVLESLYISIGQLARRFPQFVNSDFRLAERFFNSMEQDSRTRQAVQQGIGSLIFAYFNPPKAISDQFHELFFKFVQDPKVSPYSLSVVLQSANRLFNFDDIPSRFLNLLSTGNSNARVLEEARRGCNIETFRKYRFKEHEDIIQKYPEFPDFVEYLYANYENYQILSNVHAEFLSFCRECMKESAKQRNMSVHKYVLSLDESLLEKYVLIAMKGLTASGTAESLLESANAIVDIIIHCQHGSVLTQLINFMDVFQKCLFLGNDYSRKAIAKIIAIMFCFEKSDDGRESILSFLRVNLFGPKIPEKHTYSSLQTFGFIAALQAKLYHKENNEQHLILVKECVEHIVEVLEQDIKESLVTAAIEALGSFALQNGFDLLEETKIKIDSPTEKRRKLSVHKVSLIQTFFSRLKNEKSSPIKESLISTLGMLALSEADISVLNEIRENLLELSLDRQEEIAFAVGEALSAVSGGNYCTAYEDEFETLFGNLKFPESDRDSQLKFTLQQIVRKGVLSGKRIVRQNSAVYMLCILQYSSKMPVLQKYLYEIQEVFSILLSDTNEVTTEIAARGLALLYECSDEEHRSALVDSIQNQLSGNEHNSKRKVKITEDTDLNLFPPGSEPQNNRRAPKNYKELLDAAQDVGDPSMIYKLLSVSQHNQIWNTKKSAAFSVVAIVNQTQDKEKMQKILPQLVPKLFRYRHDPNHLISKSMQNMWNSLVEDSVKVVDQYLPQILKEIANGLKSNQWRIRESSANALAEVVSGRRFEEMKDYLDDLMKSIFRCCDDVKESSRKVANSTLLKLGEVTQRFCDIRKSKLANVIEALNILIPLYLKVGLVFMYKPIVYFSLEQINKIVRLSEHAIKPFASEICATLLESMSVLEDSTLSYIEQHRQRLNISQGQLDRMRVEMTKGSTIDDTIQILVPRCDDTVLPDLIPKLCHILEHGVGLPTRTAVLRFIADVAKFQRRYFRPLSQYIIKSMMNSLRSNKSPGERSQIASALPYVLNACTVNRCKNVLQDILLFYEDGDIDDQLTAGVLLVMINRKVPLLITKFFDMLIPTIFIASFDPNDKVSVAWKELLEEACLASETESVRLHLNSILEKCFSNLKHSEWKTKQQAAKALTRIAQLLKSDVPKDSRSKILEILRDALQGRIWTGKEDLLLATGYFLSLTREDDTTHDQLSKIQHESISQLVKDCTKSNKEYRLSAFAALNIAMKHAPVQKFVCTTELSNELLKICINQIEIEEKEESKSNIQFGSNDDSEFMMSPLEKIKVEAIKCLGNLNYTHMEAASNLLARYLSTRRTTPQTKALIISASNILRHVESTIENDETQLSESEKSISHKLIIGILLQLDPQQSPEKIRTFIFQEVEELLQQFHITISFPSLEKLEEMQNQEPMSHLKSRYDSLIKEIKAKEKEKEVQSNQISVPTTDQSAFDPVTGFSESGLGGNSFGGNPFGDNPFG